LAALRARGEVALRSKSLTLVEAKAALKVSVDQAIQLERLADGLLKLSRSGNWTTTSRPVNLSEIASKVVQQLQSKAQPKHITIQYEDISPEINALADADSLMQVVSILLDNAIKYSTEKTTITIHGKKDGSLATLTVQDEGIGISPPDLLHVFDRFYRADQARRQDSQSYGLGLAIAKQLVESHKGTITVRSEPGRGTTFTVKLPLG
jgi:signal transduction histidine kinase